MIMELINEYCSEMSEKLSIDLGSLLNLIKCVFETSLAFTTR